MASASKATRLGEEYAICPEDSFFEVKLIWTVL